MTETMMVIRWRGPYSFENACMLPNSGLYLCWGRNRRGAPPAQAKLLYCGISDAAGGVGSRIKGHENKPFNHPENHWWVGRVHLPTMSTRDHLEAAEWLVVRFTDVEHNWQKTRSDPQFSGYLINEWYTSENNARFRHVGVATAIPDVIGWDPAEGHLRSAASLQRK